MRHLLWVISILFFTACTPSDIPPEKMQEANRFAEEAFKDLSDSLTLLALYEATGLAPLPDTIISHADTIFTVIQVLEYQPFNAPFTFTRIEGNNYHDEVSLSRFLIEHDRECSYPL